MNRKPRKGQALLLQCSARVSSRRFLLHVTCVDALDRDDTVMRSKLPAAKTPVTIRLQDGTELEVTRGDVEPATEGSSLEPVADALAGRVVLEALEKEPEGRLKTWRDAASLFHRVCARYELGRRAAKDSR